MTIKICVSKKEQKKFVFNSENIYWLEMIVFCGYFTDEGPNAEIYAESRIRQLDEMAVFYTVIRKW